MWLYYPFCTPLGPKVHMPLTGDKGWNRIVNPGYSCLFCVFQKQKLKLIKPFDYISKIIIIIIIQKIREEAISYLALSQQEECCQSPILQVILVIANWYLNLNLLSIPKLLYCINPSWALSGPSVLVRCVILLIRQLSLICPSENLSALLLHCLLAHGGYEGLLL